jgi:mRNA interferase ChpB
MQRGEIWHVDLNPTRGREQQGKRFCLVVTPLAFNLSGTPWIVPISTGGNFARDKGFTVSLQGFGLKTEGVVLCHQLRALDMRERQATRIEKLPESILEEVMDKIMGILEG